MSELETKLRNLAARGELTHVSLVPVAGTGEYGVTFVAQVAPASRFGHVEGRDPDPVTALVNALDALPTSFVKDKPKREAESSVKEKPRERRTRETREALAARDTAEAKATEPWDIV